MSDPEDEQHVFRGLAEFFAHTINDHFHEHVPWYLDGNRVSLFHILFDSKLKDDVIESVYHTAWIHHHAMCIYIRTLILSQPSCNNQDIQRLLGRVDMGSDPAQSSVVEAPIGYGCNVGTSEWESLWFFYVHMRELVFLKNDGVSNPHVLDAPIDAEKVLRTSERVNIAFLSGFGRTHYTYALMEGPTLGDNLFITRNGAIQDSLLVISDALFWVSHDVARQLGIQDVSEHTKGVLIAAKFVKPVICGGAVSIHHHPLETSLAMCGYPGLEKNPVLFEMSYNKSVYPAIYNPSQATGVHLPPEIDWLVVETHDILDQGGDVCAAIEARLRDFAQKQGIIIIKGAAESGARNLLRFDLAKGDDLDEEQLAKAVKAVYEISLSQNVTIQRAIISNPMTWMSFKAIQSFRNRQIAENGVAVNLDRFPKDPMYGTLRVILSAGVADEWECSHWISLSSLQIATNVGRQGSLEMLAEEFIHEKHRHTFITNLEAAGKQTMKATAAFGPRFWAEGVSINGHVIPPFKELSHVPENDACGVPYWWPRYLMLDFLPEPVWGRESDGIVIECPNARLIDVVLTGEDVRFVLEDSGTHERFDGTVVRFIYWLLEPNVGIGLWPNYWRRELAQQQSLVKSGLQESVDWFKVGTSDRIVLSNYLRAGAAFLKAKLAKDVVIAGSTPQSVIDVNASTLHYIEEQLLMKASLSQALSLGAARVARQLLGLDHCRKLTLDEVKRIRESTAALFEWCLGHWRAYKWKDACRMLLSDAVSLSRLVDLTIDKLISYPLSPPVDLQASHSTSPDAVFAVIVGRTALMSHQLVPWLSYADTVIAVHVDWLVSSSGRCCATRYMDGNFVEASAKIPLAIDAAFIVELGGGDESQVHNRIVGLLDGVSVLNADATICGDKWATRQVLHVNQPKCILAKSAEECVSFSKSCKSVVIQPQFGTDGHGVAVFDACDVGGQIGHVGTLGCPVLVSEQRGGATDTPCVLRVHVIDHHPVSFTVIQGHTDDQIATLTTGDVVDLADANLGCNEFDWAHICRTAIDVSSVIPCRVIGIDMLLEELAVPSETRNVDVIVIEVNARPGTLIWGERPIEFDEDGIKRAVPVGIA